MKPLMTKMKTVLAGIAVGFTALVTTTTAQAGVSVKVNLNTQRMTVTVNGQHYATWKVSTGKRGYTTPTGNYRVQSMERMHYSRKYNNSPMPYSIFFRGGYAIHGTGAISRLGRIASHGCVRMHPAQAGELYSLIRSQGRRGTSIRIYRGPSTSKRATVVPSKRKARKKITRRSWQKKKIIKSSKKASRSRTNKKKLVIANNGTPFFIFGGLDLAN